MYLIEKIMVTNGEKRTVLMTNGYSEILELKHENLANKFCEVLNENSDSGHFYRVTPSPTKNQ